MKKEKYNQQINLYYLDELNLSLVEKVLGYFHLDQKDNDFKLIKSERKGAKVFKLNFKGENYYLKSYCYRKPIKLIKNFFRSVEAKRHLETIKRLRKANIDTIKPILSLVMKKNFFIKDSVFITKEYNAKTLYQYFSDISPKIEERKKIIKRFAILWAKLLNNNLVHQDSALSNFLVDFNSKKPKLVLLDVDNIYKYPFLPWQIVVNNLVRFNAKISLDLIRINNCAFDNRERLLLYNEFFAHYQGNIKMDQEKPSNFIKKINRLTANKLISWGHKEIIKKDPFLSFFVDNIKDF